MFGKKIKIWIEGIAMQKISFNDSWILDGKEIKLPHDAMITEKRSKDTSDGGHGYFPGGIYTYTKTPPKTNWEVFLFSISIQYIYH